MRMRPLHHLIAVSRAVVCGRHRRLLAATRPAAAPLAVGTLAGLLRGVRRPRCTPADRALLALLASRAP